MPSSEILYTTRNNETFTGYYRSSENESEIQDWLP
jgi:hypothetical protein